MGVRLDPVTRRELLEYVREAVRDGRRVTVCNLNAHAVNLAARDPEFRSTLNDADLVFCDGMAVRLAARLSGVPVPERMTPPDFIEDLCRAAGPRGVFVVGSEPDVLETGLTELGRRVPGLRAGGHHGYFETSGPENERVLRQISEFEPAIVLVGMGMPRQERWIRENRARITAPIVMPVGALLDWISGAQRRGPRWMTDHGGEWLARLFTQPRHVWRRYLIGNPLFMFRWLRSILRG